MLHPLAVVASLFVIGLLIGRAAPWTLPCNLAAALLAIIAWALLELLHFPKPACVALALTVLAAASAWWQADQSYRANNHLARLVNDTDEIPVTLRLTVLTDAIIQPRPPELSPFNSAQSTTRCVADIHAVLTNGIWQSAAGATEMLVLDAVPLNRGDTIEVVGMLARPRAPANPGTFDYQQFLQRSNIYLSLRAKSAAAVTVSPAAGTGITGYLDAFRQFLRAKLLEHTVIQDQDAGNTLVAILFGWRSPGMEQIGRAFTDAGAAHLLAISGTHVAVIAAAAWLILGFLIRRPAPRTLVLIALVAIYVLATPMGPPVLRAAIAVFLFALAKLGGRKPRALNIIAATVLIVLLLSPADILDPGFQLTFASTICLILLAPRVYRWLIKILMPAAWQTGLQEGRLPAIGIWALRILAGALSANIVGAAASAPLVAWHFHQANPWGMLTGLLLLPVISIVIVAAILQTFASLIGLGAALAAPVVWLVNHTIALVTLLAHLPAACPGIRPPPIWLIALFFAFILLWTLRHHLKLSRATALILGLSVITLGASSYTTTQRHDALNIWTLDVGHGSCIIIETPQGEHILLNAGSASRSDLTAKIIEPFLRIQAINHLDAAFLTQATRDQGNALGPLLTRYPTSHLFYSAQDALHTNYWWINALLGTLRLTSTPMRPLAAADQLDIGDLHCAILWPARTGDIALPGLTMLLTCADKRILILGGNQLPILAMIPTLDPVDIVIIENDTPPAPELIAAIPLRPGGIWITPGDDDTSLHPSQSGCIHITADSTAAPLKVETYLHSPQR